MKTILVTGGAGYIGSHAAKLLKERGYQVVVIDNFSTGHRDFIQTLGLKCYEGCISNKVLVKQILREHRVDAVMHFSALACVGEGQKDPSRYFHNNVTATQALLDAMVESGVKDFVFSSTCAVFGNPIAQRLDESHTKNPISVYGLSKLWVEQMLGAYESAYGLRSMVFRYFNAAGAWPHGGIGEDHRPETHLIPLALKAAVTGNELTVFGRDYSTPDGTCVRDYIHVLDLAEAHIKGLERLWELGICEDFNLGTGNGFSVLEVIEACRRATGKDIATKVGDRRPGDPAVLVANPVKAGKILGWEAQIRSIDRIIADAWQWYQTRML